MDQTEGLILDVTLGDEAFDRDLLEKLGHPVLVCHGPAHGSACPGIAGDCPMRDEAHGVVFQLDLDRPAHRTILKRARSILPDDVPVRAVVLPGQDVKYAEILTDVQAWVQEPTAGELDGFAAQVEAADRTR